jgi:hypothetical protein
MARIRTIKPEFFTSEDIVSLSPLARLLYIALWCESDKEGRLVWKPLTFKLRYMPGDDCNINELCAEILDRGLVKLYGQGLAYIPSFAAHQHINPRESASQLPDHEDQPRVGTRQPRVSTGANPDVHAQVGREGKGKEGIQRVGDAELPSGFASFWETWPTNDRKQAKGKCLDAWKKASAERDAALVIDHVNSMKSSREWQKQDGEFVPAPLVYLNQRRWEGAEPSTTKSSGLPPGVI